MVNTQQINNSSIQCADDSMVLSACGGSKNQNKNSKCSSDLNEQFLISIPHNRRLSHHLKKSSGGSAQNINSNGDQTGQSEANKCIVEEAKALDEEDEARDNSFQMIAEKESKIIKLMIPDNDDEQFKTSNTFRTDSEEDGDASL